jgi:hypothetical protein
MLAPEGERRLRSIRGRGAVAISAVACVAVGACATTSNSVRRGAGEFRAGLGDAVTAPFEDLNIKRVEIPPVLMRARKNPYEIAAMDRCERVAAEIGALDDALGPDMDEPPPPTPTRAQRAADFTARTGLNAVRDTTTDVIPFRSWVRRLSGAERHRKDVQDAIKAGSMRRAYLKAIGMRMNCSPPAAPSWFEPVREAAVPAPAGGAPVASAAVAPPKFRPRSAAAAGP